MSGFFSKSFASLNRHKKTQTSDLSGFKLQNNLESDSNSKITAQIQKSNSLRSKLDALSSVPQTSADPSTNSTQSPQITQKYQSKKHTDAKPKPSLSHVKTSIESSKGIFPSPLRKYLEEEPVIFLFIKSININGTRFTSNGQKPLILNISPHEEFLYFTEGAKIMENLIIQRKNNIQEIFLSNLSRSILIELQDLKGFIYITYLSDDNELISHFQNKGDLWFVDVNKRFTNKQLLDRMEKITVERALKNDHPSSNPASSNGSINDPLNKTEILHTPSKNNSRQSALPLVKTTDKSDKDSSGADEENSRPRTRSTTDSLPVKIQDEVPASFEPPLTLRFKDGKKFVVSYSDFKTLYNNDWINDSLIDFFIKYDIENAVDKGFFQASEIYAFNSFFFPKLMYQKAQGDDSVIDYYKNVKRWLNKIDLMSYAYIILPINENSHWFCCIIKGLPQILSEYLMGRKNGNSDSLAQQDECINGLNTSNSESNQNGENEPKFSRAELFIFDSLSQKHSNIHDPLKSFIIEYCKDKYGVDIPKEKFRVVNAKVPKQNNFNDCGIHVIYNVRKWLSDRNECERLWKSGPSSKYQSRQFFKSTERNNMRVLLRDTLLDLQKSPSNIIESRSNSSDENDDDIEVIEMPQSQSQVPEAEKTPTKMSTNDPNIANGTMSPKVRTPSRNAIEEKLSPSSETNFKNKEFTSASIKNSKDISTNNLLFNKSIKRRFSGKSFSKLTIEIINQIYPKDNALSKFEVDRIFDFACTINEVGKDKSLILKEVDKFLQNQDITKLPLQKPQKKNSIPTKIRPKDENLVIRDTSQNDDELNKNVEDLNLSDHNPPSADASFKSFPNKRRKLYEADIA